MTVRPGHCGVCNAPLEIKVLIDRLSPQAATRPFCPSEADEAHKQAEQRGWDPYEPEQPPVR